MALTVLALIVIIIGLCSDYKNHNMKYPEPKNPYLKENSKRCEEIYKILMGNGFACSNVALGVGSFSMQCVEEEGILKPFTRDTFSSCIKATYCEIAGQPYPIFKNPKDGGFKKSQKGCCVVKLDENGNYTYKDEYTWAEAINDTENQLVTVFKDGKMVKEQSLAEIRNILHGGKF